MLNPDTAQLRDAVATPKLSIARKTPRLTLGCYGGIKEGRDIPMGGINKDGTRLAQQESSGTSRAKERDMEAKASKHASKCEQWGASFEIRLFSPLGELKW